MNLAEETTSVLNYLRIIQKKNKIITELKLQIKEGKKNHLKDINKYKFFKYNKVNRGDSSQNKYKQKQKIKDVFRELNKDLEIIGFGIFGSINIAETVPNSVSNDFEIKFHQRQPINNNVESSMFFKDKAFITDKSYHLFRKDMKLADRTLSLHSKGV